MLGMPDRPCRRYRRSTVPTARPLRLAACVSLLGLLLAGCVASQSGRAGGSDETLVDSLRSRVATLQDRQQTLRDSLSFFEDIDSGAYYREMRALRDQLTRMSYELGALRDGGTTLTVLNADALFEPATATITEAGANRLKGVAEQIRRVYPNRRVRIEGHADTSPLSESMQERYPTNWELSCARAAAVLRALQDMSGIDAGQFVAVGYGATDPVASNETRAGRERNRRVRVAVLPTPRDYARPFEMSW